jgi:hypothetical protein
MEDGCLYDIVDERTGEILVEGIRWEIDVHLEIFKRGWTLRSIDEINFPADGEGTWFADSSLAASWANVFVTRSCNPATTVV